MARCPFAVWRPLPENSTQGGISPDQVILHSAVDAPGPSSIWGYFDQEYVRVESHFFIKNDGVIEQYMDTNVRADANLESNGRAVSIETEDDGDPNHKPWTDAQMASIKRLLTWLFQTHPKILRRVCPDAYSPGVGWHSMWGTGPTPWIPYSSRGKTCPGTIRIGQIKTDIIPWINGDEEDMPTAQEVAAAVWAYKVPNVDPAKGEAPAESHLRWTNRYAELAYEWSKETNNDVAALPSAVADAVVARLPAGSGGTSIDYELVKSAVRQAFAEAFSNPV